MLTRKIFIFALNFFNINLGEYMFEKKVYINSSEVDENLDLTIPSFFKIIQDIAVDAVEDLGLGMNINFKKNIMWVFTRVLATFYRMPKYQETVIFKTYASKKLRFIFPRYFEVASLEGETLIRLSSTWALIHGNTRQIYFDNENIFDLKEEHFEGELPLPGKIEPKEAKLVKKYEVQYTDLDLNRHMNNVSYINQILNLKDSEFYHDNQIYSLLINYEKEIEDKKTISLFVDENEETYIRGEVDDNASFEAIVKYRKKG